MTQIQIIRCSKVDYQLFNKKKLMHPTTHFHDTFQLIVEESESDLRCLFTFFDNMWSVTSTRKVQSNDFARE